MEHLAPRIVIAAPALLGVSLITGSHPGVVGSTAALVNLISRDPGRGECTTKGPVPTRTATLLATAGFQIQCGSLTLVADPDNPAGAGLVRMDARHGGFDRGEYHCWLARQVGARVEVVDLSARHYRRYVEQLNPIVAAITLPGGGSVHIPDDSEDRIHWTRAGEPPAWLWTTNGHAQGYAYFHPDEGPAEPSGPCWPPIQRSACCGTRYGGITLPRTRRQRRSPEPCSPSSAEAREEIQHGHLLASLSYPTTHADAR